MRRPTLLAALIPCLLIPGGDPTLCAIIERFLPDSLGELMEGSVGS